MDSKKPIVWMILFGVVRHVFAYFGQWLETHGMIDPDTHQRLLSEGVTDTVGWLLVIAPVLWSVAQKLQAWEWVKTALHLKSDVTPVTEIPNIAAGPSLPL
jgi:hypothetical protein